MEPFLCLLFLYFNTFETAAAVNKPIQTLELIKSPRNNRFTYLHAIEEDLYDQIWGEQEQPCLHQLINVIRNVQNSTLWATWIWDSMQFPVGQLYGSRTHLGNFDQCMNLPLNDHPEFKTQYCLAELILTEIDPEVTTVNFLGSVQRYMRHKTKFNLRYNNLIWGICVPVTCKSESITKFANAMFRATHLGQMELQVNITVNSDYCQVAGEKVEFGLREYSCLLLVIFFIIMTRLYTFYRSLKGEESMSTDFAKAFDIKINTERLTNVEDLTIRSLLGIRIILVFCIIICHQTFMAYIIGINNGDEIDKILENPIQRIRFNADLSVDIFFMLSGLLMTSNLVGGKAKTFNIFTVIAKRYFRLMCIIVFVLLILPTVCLYGNSGPWIKRHMQPEIDICYRNWWKNVLMIANYHDIENICYGSLWSVFCDFHFSIIGVLICWIYLKSKRAGIKAYTVITVASMIIPVVHGYIHSNPAVITFDFKFADNYRKHLIGDPAYVQSHLRAGPYFVGMAFGYLIALFPTEKHKNFISKKLSITTFFVLLFLLGLLFTISGIHHGLEYGPLEGALFSVMRRNVIAALTGVLVIICEYGTLPYVSNALSWSGLGPFSKLSYGVYVTHLMFIMRFTWKLRVPPYGDLLNDAYSTISMVAVTNVVSFFIWLFWEMPLVNLFNLILKRSNKVQQFKSNGKLSTISPRHEEDAKDKSEKKSN